MKIEKLTAEKLQSFLEYCKTYEKVHDESFLSEDELSSFNIDENITFILLKDEKIYGTFSIMLKRKGRVRIFHVIKNDFQAYRQLHEVMTDTLKNEFQIFKYNLFIPEIKTEVYEILKNLGLKFERFVYVLERDITSIRESSFPDESDLRPMVFPDDAKHWANIRNTAFKALDGFVPYSEEFFKKMNDESDYIQEGTLILRIKNKPVGIIKVSKDIQGDDIFGFIGPIAVLPEYQGKGIGRNMLRAIVKLVTDKGWKCSLCVNANNEDALKLYLNEGFYKDEAVMALNYTIGE